jgi:hypothetical protein
MIGAYLGTDRAAIAIDGEASEASLESFAGMGAACHVVVPISFDAARLRRAGLP